MKGKLEKTNMVFSITLKIVLTSQKSFDLRASLKRFWGYPTVKDSDFENYF
jgi:hypothetical protein